MTDLTKKLKNEFGLDIDIKKFLENSADKSKLKYLAPELLYPLLIHEAIKQNPKAISEGKKILETILQTKVIPKIEEKLEIHIQEIPKLKIEKTESSSQAFFGLDSKIHIRDVFLLKMIMEPDLAVDALMHESTHFISCKFNPLSLQCINNKNVDFLGRYHRGNFLDDSALAQSEGLALFVTGVNQSNTQTYELLNRELMHTENEWEKINLVRRFYDNQYDFGFAVYQLLDLAFGKSAVKKLAFEEVKTREELLEIYRDSCKKLNIPIIQFQKRKKLFQQVYEEYRLYNKIKEEPNLTKSLSEIDIAMEKLLREGKEPKILYYDSKNRDEKHNLSLIEVLSNSYWHYAVMCWDQYSPPYSLEHSEKKLNFENGDVIDLWSELDNDWTIYLSQKDGPFNNDSEIIESVKDRIKVIEV